MAKALSYLATLLLLTLMVIQRGQTAPTAAPHSGNQRLDQQHLNYETKGDLSETSYSEMNEDTGNQLLESDPAPPARVPYKAIHEVTRSSSDLAGQQYASIAASASPLVPLENQRPLDDEAINKTASYDYSPSVPVTQRPSTSYSSQSAAESSSTSVPELTIPSSTPTAAVPRKKIRRSTTTTALPPTTDSEGHSPSSSSTTSIVTESVSTTTEDSPTVPSAVSPRSKTRKLKKKVSKKVQELESSTQQSSEGTSAIISTVEQEEEITTTMTTRNSEPVSSTESNKDRDSHDDDEEDNNRKSMVLMDTNERKEEEEEGLLLNGHRMDYSSSSSSSPSTESPIATTTETPSIDEHDRGNPMVTLSPITRTTTENVIIPETSTEFRASEQSTEIPSTMSTSTQPINEVTLATATQSPSTVDSLSAAMVVTRTTPALETSTAATYIQLASETAPVASATAHPPLLLPGSGSSTTLATIEAEPETNTQEPQLGNEGRESKEDSVDSMMLMPHLVTESTVTVTPTTQRTDEEEGEEEDSHRTTLESGLRSATSQHPQTTTETPIVTNSEVEGLKLTTSTPTTSVTQEGGVQEEETMPLITSTPVIVQETGDEESGSHSDFVTHTPLEVSSSSDTEMRHGIPSTTVFEDSNQSAITTTTEFISATQPAGEEVTGITKQTTTTERALPSHGEEGHEEEAIVVLTTQSTTLPTSEPHVDGINVENVEEDLSPIPEDDVLVVEIEESSEAGDPTTSTTTAPQVMTTTALPPSQSIPDLVTQSPPQRPRLNDELFYPIGGEVGGGGEGGEDLEGDVDDLETRDETSDGRSNDNDGDFDLEAEIFPTIPVPKNKFFESEILREKSDLKDDAEEEQVTSTTIGQSTSSTSTAVTERTTTTTEEDLSQEVSTTTTTIKPEGGVSTVSHDSDTFFYISNTEVKVEEPVAESTEPRGGEEEPQPQHKELSFAEITDEENVSVALPDQNHPDRGLAAVELSTLDENIILSPVASQKDQHHHNNNNGEFDFVKFAAADRPHRVVQEEEGEEREDEGEERDVLKKNKFIEEEEESAEQLSFVKVEETTDMYSSEEAFEFLHKPSHSEVVPPVQPRSKEDSIPEVIIEPYPQLMDTDNDLPLSIGVPVIAELPQQIQISTSKEKEQEQDKETPPGYHHFDIDNREVETMDSSDRTDIKTVRKLKKSRGGKKQQLLAKKKNRDRDHEQQFADMVFENADSLLVKNPSISLEVPVIDFNFSILTSTSTMEPKLNFTNETTLVLEEEPIGINDLQTLFFTCFITLLLLLAVGCLAFVARFLWIKHYLYGTGLIGDNSADPLASKSRTLSTEEFKSRDSGISMFKNHDLEATTTSTTDQYGNGIVSATTLLNHHNNNCKNGDAPTEANGTKTVPYATGTNGSIITMTLKNNHLIVETEERNDISRDARETKMHYSPSDKDGVFVVEVARGADTSYQSPRTSMAPPHHQFNGVDLLNTSSTPVDASKHTGTQEQQQQRVQVHHHPPPSSTEAAETNGRLKSSTGLSQSDLSDSSSAGSNKDYNYGSQGGAYAVETSAGAHHQSVAVHQQQTRPGVAKQETIDLEPRLQSDIDLFNVETERRDLHHCNGHSEGGNSVMPDILVKSSAPLATVPEGVASSVES